MHDIHDKRYRALEPCMRSLFMNTPPGWMRLTSPFEIRLICPEKGAVALAFADLPEVLSLGVCERLPPELYAEALFFKGEKDEYIALLRSSKRARRYIIKINERYGDYTPQTTEAVAIARAVQAEQAIQKAMQEIHDAHG